MKTKLIDNNIDIYKFPNPKEISPNFGAVTIGDMHGNSVKFIHFLLQQGVIQIDSKTPENDYAEFVKMYDDFSGVIAFYDEKKSGIEYYQKLIAEKNVGKQTEKIKKYIHEWTEEIRKLEEEFRQGLKVWPSLKDLVEKFDVFMKKLAIKKNLSFIRLIGDEFADRGSCDYFTLKIFSFLKKNDIKVATLLSNHSNEFIEAYEHLMKGEEFNPLNSVSDRQKPSFLGLKYLLKDKIISGEDVKKMVNNDYKPTLKVLDYTLSDNGIRLFTHAPVKLDIIQHLATLFKVVFDASSKEALAATIDKINIKFQQVVEKNEVHTFFAPRGTLSADNMSELEVRQWPIMYITWNRWNANKDATDERPAVLNNYNIEYVHGHDPYQGPNHVTNLDTNAGKMARCGLIRLSENPEQIITCDIIRMSALPEDQQTYTKNTMFLVGDGMYFLDISKKEQNEPLKKILKDEKNKENYEKIIAINAPKEQEPKPRKANNDELIIINSLLGRIPVEEMKHKINNKPAYMMFNSILYGVDISPIFKVIKFAAVSTRDLEELFDKNYDKLIHATAEHLEKLPPLKDQVVPSTMHQYKILDSNEKKLDKEYAPNDIDKEFSQSQSPDPKELSHSKPLDPKELSESQSPDPKELSHSKPLDPKELSESQSLEPSVKRLMDLCTNYRTHLIKNPDKKSVKIGIIDNMILVLEDKSQNNNVKKMEQFKGIFEKNKGTLTAHMDNAGIQFLAAIGHFLTFGIISKLTKGTFKFWQSHGGALSENISEIQDNRPKII